MKIDEAVNIINSTMTVRAKVDEGVMYVHEKLNRDDNWFMRVSLYHFGWSAITADFDTCLDDDVEVMDLARVMDVVQLLICTPVKERFPEKKYVLSAMRCAEGPVPIKQYVNAIKTSTNNVEFHFGFADEKADAMEFTQKELDDLSDFFPKVAIDAMKEPAEGKDE
ncbi:hypothetical protein V0Q12_06765 [Limosilactobacillus reuteri]|uniref:hypothetical protein n=1 Tax=Limosilactobacillus reuteri TaxID=1598 RepID=UPI002E7AB2E1|nr:hypothetical protein [Limosilactobacillus reuteri]MEE1989260.1 hypothetical protein [Limosilactobacillus reuteri]